MKEEYIYEATFSQTIQTPASSGKTYQKESYQKQ